MWIVGWERGLSDCQATADCSWATAKSMPQIPKLFYPKWHRYPIPTPWQRDHENRNEQMQIHASGHRRRWRLAEEQPPQRIRNLPCYWHLTRTQCKEPGSRRASQADAFRGRDAIQWFGPDPHLPAWPTPGRTGNRTATYIMQPQQFPPLRIRLYVTLEVNIVAFLDIIRCQSWAQA